MIASRSNSRLDRLSGTGLGLIGLLRLEESPFLVADREAKGKTPERIAKKGEKRDKSVDAIPRLRHVETRSHREFWRTESKDVARDEIMRSKSSLRKREPSGNLPTSLLAPATAEIGTWSSPLEIRTRKAEISTRAALLSEEIPQFARDHDTAGDKSQEGGSGLQGVTIVMHMKDKDDLAIDADLTRDQNGKIDDNTNLVVAGLTEHHDSIGLGIVVNSQPDQCGSDAPETSRSVSAGGGYVAASHPTEHQEYSDNQASSGSELSVVKLDGENEDVANAGTHPQQILIAPPPSPRLPTLNPSSTVYLGTHDPVEDEWHDYLEWRDLVNSVQQGPDARYDDAESSYGYDSGFRQEARSSQLFNNNDDDDDGGENKDDPIVSWSQPPRDTLPRPPRTRHRHTPHAYLPQRTVGHRSASDPACLVHGGSPLRQVTHARDLVSVGGGAAWVSERCEVGPRGGGGGREPWWRSVAAGAEETDVWGAGAAIMTAPAAARFPSSYPALRSVSLRASICVTLLASLKSPPDAGVLLAPDLEERVVVLRHTTALLASIKSLLLDDDGTEEELIVLLDAQMGVNCLLPGALAGDIVRGHVDGPRDDLVLAILVSNMDLGRHLIVHWNDLDLQTPDFFLASDLCLDGVTGVLRLRSELSDLSVLEDDTIEPVLLGDDYVILDRPALLHHSEALLLRLLVFRHGQCRNRVDATNVYLDGERGLRVELNPHTFPLVHWEGEAVLPGHVLGHGLGKVPYFVEGKPAQFGGSSLVSF
ncbi:hypothetical protein DL769_000351 [Monosporascus sp. CRB-8-3]|nr:hypothetical protein DL769_000351 [Monosporascus sp. CRB-8-3]